MNSNVNEIEKKESNQYLGVLLGFVVLVGAALIGRAIGWAIGTLLGKAIVSVMSRGES
jgi:hypothetical protein